MKRFISSQTRKIRSYIGVARRRFGSKVVQYPRVAPGAESGSFVENFSRQLTDKNVRYMCGDNDRFKKTFHIERKHASAVLSAIRDAGSERVIIEHDRKYLPLSRARTIGTSPAKIAIRCVEFEHEGANTLQRYASLIEVQLWGEHRAADGTIFHQALSANPYYHRLKPDTFDVLMASSNDITADRHEHLYDIHFPIDLVYTWVDDRDPIWLAEKERYAGASTASAKAKGIERFNNRDELRYSLRSVAMFAPWVRNIFIVTADQVPEWLNTDHPKIKVVSHREIYRDPSVLPTFNSSSIETQLHHIDGLSEHFIYFNDDFFLGEFCHPEDFFLANGQMKFCPSPSRAVEASLDETREEYLWADFNAIQLMRRDIGKFARQIMQHSPYPSRRSQLYEIETAHKADFDQCAAQRFRSFRDLRPIAFMQYHYGFHRGLALPSTLSHRYLALWKPHIRQQLDETLRKRGYKTLCINDVGVADHERKSVNDLAIKFMESYFPICSPFERSTQ